MDILVKNVPKGIIKSKSIDFYLLIDLLKINEFLDFKELDDIDISQGIIDSFNDMNKEIKENGLKNFTSIVS